MQTVCWRRCRFALISHRYVQYIYWKNALLLCKVLSIDIDSLAFAFQDVCTARLFFVRQIERRSNYHSIWKMAILLSQSSSFIFLRIVFWWGRRNAPTHECVPWHIVFTFYQVRLIKLPCLPRVRHIATEMSAIERTCPECNIYIYLLYVYGWAEPEVKEEKTEESYTVYLIVNWGGWRQRFPRYVRIYEDHFSWED